MTGGMTTMKSIGVGKFFGSKNEKRDNFKDSLNLWFSMSRMCLDAPLYNYDE